MTNDDQHFSFDDYDQEKEVDKHNVKSNSPNTTVEYENTYSDPSFEEDSFVTTSNGSTTTVKNKDMKFVFFYGL